jgi:hypothetical protein
LIWALLALIGVPIWLIVGVLGGAVWSRRSFKRQPGVFKLATRPVGAEGWKRSGAGYARCISNVLVVNAGLALVRTNVEAVVRVDNLDLASGVKGFDDPLGRLVIFTDGHEIEAAVEREFVGEIDALVSV